MSHFTVLVVGDNVDEQLLAYHEFECTGIKDQYVIEIDETDEHMASYEEETIDAVFNSDGVFVSSKYSSKLSHYKNRDNELVLPTGWEIRNTLIEDVMSFEEYLTDWHGYRMDGTYSDFRDGR